MAADATKTLRSAPAAIRPGEVVAGKYRIVRELGRGGMGIVYEAEDTRLRRTVALKFLPPESTADAAARERFTAEAQAASGLDDPHICNIHDIDETESGAVYIAMACYKGESLKDRLARGPLGPSEAVTVALQAAQGLAKAHEHGIVHRDVKPGNIFITPEGVVKLLDFGLAKLAGAAALTAPGTTVGTVAYMSPEQARGDAVDARTDVWSLGVVLYEMATGELPFGREREAAILHAVLHEPPRAVAPLGPGLPAELEAVVRRALEKDPARRFASAAEMADALRDLKTKMDAGRTKTIRRWVFRRSRKPLVLGAAGASLALIAAGVWLVTRPSIAFESRDKLMVADAENLTGDKVFDLALRTAIEAALQQSPYALVFDKAQIADTLRLMRVDPGSRIDETLGYEICRFAAVRAFVQPRILAAGEAYDIEAVLIDPVRRRQVDRIRVTARGREDVLLHGIDALARRLRSRLGESLRSVDRAARPVATVTTSSWEALDYFSLAQVKRGESKFKEAVTLYEMALDKDPKFVAARGSLALVLIQFMNEPDKGKAMLSQALRDAESQELPEKDVLPLKANVRQFVDGDLEGALAENRAIMGIFPDLMPPYNNAGRILQSLGRYDEAAAMYEEAARRAPRNSIPLQNLWYLQNYYRKDVAASESVARRYVALAPALANPHSLLGYNLAVQEKFDEAERELRRTLEIEAGHPYAVANLGHILYAVGRASEAVPLYRKTVDLAKQKQATGMPEWDCVGLIMALRESGQAAEAAKAAAEARGFIRDRLGGKTPEPSDWTVLGAVAAAEGNAAEAEACARRVRPDGLKDAESLMDLAELDALLGRPGGAIVELIKKSLASGYGDPFFPVILPEFRGLRKDPAFRRLFSLR